MIKKIAFCFICLNVSIAHCQTVVEYGERGNKAFFDGDYKTADSFYTKALELGPDINITINRGVARLMLHDTCSACADFKRSAGRVFRLDGVLFFEKDIEEVYNNVCINISDTIYFDKEYNQVNRGVKYRYYEIVKTEKCESNSLGELHKKGYIMGPQILASGDLEIRPDIIALFEPEDSVNYYTYVYDYNSGSVLDNNISPKEDDFLEYIDFKYDFSNLPHKDRWINFRLYLNPEGKILDCKMLECPVKKMQIDIEQLQKDILKFLKDIPSLPGPEVFGKKVFFTLDMIMGV
jgi:hypothetical protein